jgi:hypothetical protein
MRNRRAFVQLLFALATLDTPAALAQSAGQEASSKPAPFIGRVIGIYDAETGSPIEAVEVMDVASRISALTTSTGTVALSFVDTAGSLIRIRKLGYESLMMPIANSPGSIPLTILLKRSGQLLPATVTTAKRVRALADTVRKLELSGFYERRTTSGASPSAFMTAEQIERLTTFDDFQAVTGRPICVENLYVDGVRIANTNRDNAFWKMRQRAGARALHESLIDEVVKPTEVAAIENYRVSEVPAEFNATKDPGAGSCGVTLVWTK